MTTIAALVLVCAAAQDSVPKAPQAPQADAPAATAPQTPPALVPGELPRDASEPARAAWAKLIDATRESEEVVDPTTQARVRRPKQVAPPTGFDITLDITAHPRDAQSNDLPSTRYRFLPPGFVRTTVLKSGRERLRGPKGDFLIDGGLVTPLSGREFEEDRREIASALAVANNFLALADPRKLRIAKLELVDRPPPELPPSLRALGATLTWLAIESPDFDLIASQKRQGQGLYRVELGLEPATSLPALALIADSIEGQRVLDANALLVRMSNYRPLDGFVVPFALKSHERELQSPAPMFEDLSSADIYLKQKDATLRPGLQPQDFTPPGR